MQVERTRPGVFRLTLHAMELSALVAAARWVVQGADGELTPQARDQLREVLESYDTERRRADAVAAEANG